MNDYMCTLKMSLPSKKQDSYLQSCCSPKQPYTNPYEINFVNCKADKVNKKTSLFTLL